MESSPPPADKDPSMPLRLLRRFIPEQLQPRLLPKPASRYPADPRAVFILILCIVSGLPLILTDIEPGSLESLMPTWWIVLWGLALVCGAGCALWGMSRQTVDGILVEQVGSVIVGCSSIIYSAAIIIAVGSSGIVSAGIVFGWGLSCFWRWLQLQALVVQGVAVVEGGKP